MHLLIAQQPPAQVAGTMPVPTVFAVVCAIAIGLLVGGFVAWFFWHIAKGPLSRWSSQNSKSRTLTSALLKLVSVGAVGIGVELVGFSDLRQGRGTPDDLLWAFGAALLSAFAGLFDVFFASIQDQLNEDLTNERQATHDLRRDLQTASAEIEDANKIARTAQRERDFYEQATRAFMGVVTKKQEALSRLLKIRRKEKRSITMDEWKDALDTDGRCAELIQTTFFIFDLWFKGEHPDGDLRIAYFQASEGYLKVVHCYNRSSNVDCVTSPNEANRDRFEMSNGKSMAVGAARTEAIVIAAEANAANITSSHPYFHFDDAQNQRIKSAVCIPIGSRKNGCCHHVISIDCNKFNFFQDKYLLRYKFIQDNLERRLLYECAVETVLAS